MVMSSQPPLSIRGRLLQFPLTNLHKDCSIMAQSRVPMEAMRPASGSEAAPSVLAGGGGSRECS